MLNLNINALTYLSLLYANKMKMRNKGYILNIGSLGACQPVPYFASYAASKSYVLNFSEAIALELKDYGITVTCVSPGNTNTNFFKNSHTFKQLKFYKNIGDDSYLVAKYAVNCLCNKKFYGIYGLKNKLISFLIKFFPSILAAKLARMSVTSK